MTLLAGDIILGKYRVVEQIGQGGRSLTGVYRALHTDLMVYRAVKVLHTNMAHPFGSAIGDDTGLDAANQIELQQCFRAGAQYAARLNHSHIIQIYDFGQYGTQLALVMELAQGGSLADRLQAIRESERLMSVSECVRVAREVAEGMAAIHAIDVVHRDLKPSNILFDAQGRVKIGDLGLAQVPDGMAMLSQVGQVGIVHPGTLLYMSPEQKDSSDYLSPASDVYALGVILFEMLTGRHYRNIRPGTRTSSLRSLTPPWLDHLILRMLAESPHDRPWDGTEVATALRQEIAPQIPCPQDPISNESLQQQEETAPPVAQYPSGVETVVPQRRSQPAPQVVQPVSMLPATPPKMHSPIPPNGTTPLRCGTTPEHASGMADTEPASPAIAVMVMPLVAQQPPGIEHAAPESPVEIGGQLIRIAGGPFLMGSTGLDAMATDDEKPQHEVILMTYRIGKYPVTCANYLRFVTSTGHTWRCNEARKPERANHPAVVVNWFDARAYCEWLTMVWRTEKRIAENEVVRLPTEPEWEKACRGIDGRIWPSGIFPLGTEYASHMNIGNTDTMAVDAHCPLGNSPYGVADMAGNVWEWTSTAWGNASHGHYPYPYTMNDGRENPDTSDDVQRVLRGGSFYNTLSVVRCATRYRFNPGYDSRGVGFRIVVAPVAPGPSN